MIVLAHLIGHGWRDLLVYGGGAIGIAAGFMIYSSGRWRPAYTATSMAMFIRPTKCLSSADPPR